MLPDNLIQQTDHIQYPSQLRKISTLSVIDQISDDSLLLLTDPQVRNYAVTVSTLINKINYIVKELINNSNISNLETLTNSLNSLKNELLTNINQYLDNNYYNQETINSKIADLKTNINSNFYSKDETYSQNQINGIQDSLQNQINQISQELNGINNEDINYNNSRIDQLEQQLRNFSQNQIEQIQNQINKISQELNGINNEDINYNNSRIDRLEQQLRNFSQDQIEQIQNQINKISQELNGINNEDINYNNSRIDRLEQQLRNFSQDQIEQIQNQINKISQELNGINNEDINYNNSRIDRLEQQLENLQPGTNIDPIEKIIWNTTGITNNTNEFILINDNISFQFDKGTVTVKYKDGRDSQEITNEAIFQTSGGTINGNTIILTPNLSAGTKNITVNYKNHQASEKISFKIKKPEYTNYLWFVDEYNYLGIKNILENDGININNSDLINLSCDSSNGCPFKANSDNPYNIQSIILQKFYTNSESEFDDNQSVYMIIPSEYITTQNKILINNKQLKSGILPITSILSEESIQVKHQSSLNNYPKFINYSIIKIHDNINEGINLNI